MAMRAKSRYPYSLCGTARLQPVASRCEPGAIMSSSEEEEEEASIRERGPRPRSLVDGYSKTYRNRTPSQKRRSAATSLAPWERFSLLGVVPTEVPNAPG